MKRIVSALLALAVLAALVIVTTVSKHGVRAVYASTGCTNTTLTGRYAFSGPGFAPPKGRNGTDTWPFADVGVLTFDGAGNVSLSYTEAYNGVISTGYTGAGTYSVNSDCTGSVSFTSGDAGGATLSFIIIGGGTEAIGINTTNTLTATFDAKKQ